MSNLVRTSSLIMGIIDDIDVSKIIPSPNRLRFDMGNIEEIARSIKQKGLLQPIVVRTKGEGFEIVAGNRRYHACKTLRWRKIVCHIVELDDKSAFEVSLIENVQRKTMNTIDEAKAFKIYVSDFGWGGITELAAKIGKSVSYITKRIKLLDLPPDVLDSIVNSTINTSTAEELLCIKNRNEQSHLAELISRRHLSLRNVRHMVKNSEKEAQVRQGQQLEEQGSDSTSGYTHSYTDFLSYQPSDLATQKAERSFDKSIIALRLAMNKIGSIISSIDENWIIFEVLMQHKNMLHDQIDLLIKEKKKI